MDERNQDYRAVMIGCGRMGLTIDDEIRDRDPNAGHLPHSHGAAYSQAEGVDLVAAADIDETNLQQVSDRLNIHGRYTDYRTMIEEEDPDIVTITTRPGTHAEMITFAANAGVPAIHCEKPLCQSVTEAEELVEVCQENGVHFNMNTHRRFQPLYQHLRSVIAGGELGEVNAIIAQCGDGSALWSHSHAIDMLLYLGLDENVEWVQGEAEFSDDDLDGHRLTRDPTIRMGHFKFENGTRAYLTRGSGYEFEVSGEDGKLRTSNKGRFGSLRVVNEDGLLEEASFPSFEPSSGTLGGARELVHALDGNDDTSSPIKTAAAGQELCMGIIESERQDGARVSVPLSGDARERYIDPGNW